MSGYILLEEELDKVKRSLVTGREAKDSRLLSARLMKLGMLINTGWVVLLGDLLYLKPERESRLASILNCRRVDLRGTVGVGKVKSTLRKKLLCSV